MDEIKVFYGITRNPKTRDYMMVLNIACEKCHYMCYSKCFQLNFLNWTSGNKHIDIFIQNIQLTAHKDMRKAIEWISYDKINNIKCIAKNRYIANWIDGYIIDWDYGNENWKRKGRNMIVELEKLNNSMFITSEFMNKTKTNYIFYGITQNPKTKDYMMVLNKKCKSCNYICNAIHFQQNFLNWTGGNNDINKFIQNTQLSAHKDVGEVLEWIPNDKFNNIKCIAKDTRYIANWIDGYISDWDYGNENWERKGKNMIVELKKLINSNNITSEFMDEIKVIYGITQNLKTMDYMMVLGDKCKKCKFVCYAIYFQQNFGNWTSDNDDIDKFIQDTQLLSHKNAIKAIEWIPNNSLYNIKCITTDTYMANWTDGNIIGRNNKNQDWEREGQNMIVELKRLNNPKNIALEFMDESKIFYGMTQISETKDYMIVLNNKCKKCNRTYYVKCLQQDFKSWNSGSININKFIQDIQLTAHDDAEKILEWIPYNRFYNIKYIAENMYEANWIDGNIIFWCNKNKNWVRKGQNMFVNLRSLNSKIITSEFINELTIDYKVYGITQDSKTKTYMMVLGYNEKCKLCNSMCYTIFFQQNFKNWTSGNNDINKFIQDTQLSVHDDVKKALEWIPYDRLYNIKYIAKGGFGKVYKANWIDGYVTDWDNEHQNRKRYNENMLVALKSLDNSERVTLEFINEAMSHKKVNDNYYIIKFYGITQDPETRNYMMVLDYAESGSLRDYLEKNYRELNWETKINYLYCISSALENIHGNELIHRDLHMGNILKNYDNILITDLGLCKPANCNSLENTKNNIYGVLPYIAPEILRGQSYTKASDIYSFGIVMYEVISGLSPYHDLINDEFLAAKICQGLRPRFKTIKVPPFIVHLIKRCLDANLLNRPTAFEVRDKLWGFKFENSVELIELQKQIKEIHDNNTHENSVELIELQKQIEEIHDNNTSLTSSSYRMHSKANYTGSSLLSFNNLSVPKNSDDYYEQNGDIISEKFSGIN
ncbi:Tpk2p [Rhizophagus irregularis DAOM 197198w]|uniref:Tpk2p n=1 Tax=Rhizophagus irregularis (strain DAOM 197198w) TaxID=1432141 RepID=A0A015LFP8_RHIIW|nr:Tpk2p [Rhizophagus irregularis DAOM 197198w]